MVIEHLKSPDANGFCGRVRRWRIRNKRNGTKQTKSSVFFVCFVLSLDLMQGVSACSIFRSPRLANQRDDLLRASFKVQPVAICIPAQIDISVLDHDPEALMRKEEDSDQCEAEYCIPCIHQRRSGIVFNQEHVCV